MSEFLGVIQPVDGRWQWPFRQMKEGDWFLVNWEQRDPESVRNLAAVKGSQLGKGMKVEKRPHDHPGYTKVTCVEQGSLRKREVPVGKVDYEFVLNVLDRCYEVHADELAWTALNPGQCQELSAQQIEAPANDEYVVAILNGWNFKLTLLKDRIQLLCTRSPLATRREPVMVEPTEADETLAALSQRPDNHEEELKDIMS